jgi:hypothetical protein
MARRFVHRTTAQEGSGEVGMTDEGQMAWRRLTELWRNVEGGAAPGHGIARPVLSSWLRLPKRNGAATMFGQSALGR